MGSEFDKHFANDGFAASDPASQPNLEQEDVTLDGTNLTRGCSAGVPPARLQAERLQVPDS